MPKYKIRKAGDEIKLSKGKCAFEMNFDILDQCVDDKKDCESEAQTGDTEELCDIVDTRSFDDIILDAFKELNRKSSRERANTLETICTQLQQFHNPKFLAKHIDRLKSFIQYSLESTDPCEINAAANLISLVAIQLPDKSMDIFYKPLRSVIQSDHFRSSVLSSVCHAIGILTFLYESNPEKIVSVMKEFQCIFGREHEVKNYQFQIAAFEVWIFLMTLLPSRLDKRTAFCLSSVEHIFTLLNSTHYDIRVTCAKAVAVICECGMDDDKIYLEPYLTKIVPRISTIIDAWNKNASDFKSTPQVRQYLEKGTPPCAEIRYGKCVLQLNNWALNVRYEMLRTILGSTNVAKHLSQNEKLLTKLKMSSQSECCYRFTPVLLQDKISSRVACEEIPVMVPVTTQEYDLKKISTNFEFAANKSSTERVKALEEICKELQQNVVPHAFLEDQKNLILDIVCKGMKRGSDAEQSAVVRMATLTILQLGRDERFCSEISKLFLSSLRLRTASESVNSLICTALAFFELADDEETSSRNFEPTMHLLKEIFSGNHSHYKTSNAHSSSEGLNSLRVKAMEAWGLLLTLCSPKVVCSIVSSETVKDLIDMLHTSNDEFRVSCCQIISLIVEKGRTFDNSFLNSDVKDLCNVVKDLINNPSSVSKNKRITQKTKLREVLTCLENGSTPSFTLRFGNEVHKLTTWCAILKHQKLSQVIGQNLEAHLSQNERLRRIVTIGSKPVPLPFQLNPNLEHKLSSAAKKKSKTKEMRLNGRTPKFGYV
ncbi:Interferon-related developmental regulator 1 [Pseudolycoriella hygida]|uniref:Interferon-related developmental regulator 1 n=1 Tax=Pseudolycoriella hygida TaxID=35572 RepID=A0A9Q0S0D8_9DIPT|nr:Interferon-related developmental regulator 1 [Pseudolycoriella hygida]